MFYQSIKRKYTRVQNILHDPTISFHVDNRAFHGYGRVIEDAVETDLINRISQLMDKKYGWSDGLIVELCFFMS